MSRLPASGSDDATTIISGNYFTINISQVSSTIAGADLTLVVTLS